MMKSGFRVSRVIAVLSALMLMMAATVAFGQSGATRPRRVTTTQPADAAPAPSSSPTTTPSAAASTRTTTPRAAPSTGATASVARAYSLLEQKQYEAAKKEAKQIASSDASNSEAWKIAGFAGVNLRQYAEAAADLQRALDLQRAAGAEDANTLDALAQAYVRTEDYERALPLLVTATTRKGATPPDALMLYYRGLAEYRTGKAADAERSFNASVKADPKNSAALFYAGRIAFERKDDAAAIAALNRATLADPKLADAWALLTYAYMRRAAAATGAKADADNLNAVRASEGLTRARSDETSVALNGQALIGAGQYVRAATVLERVAAGDNAQATTLYLLGFAHSRAKNFPKAITALERAAAKTPDDVNIYRELGYVYEANKQYAKALATYERGLQLAPGDAYFTESAERIRPFAK